MTERPGPVAPGVLRRVPALVRRAPFVAATVAVGVLGLLLTVAGLSLAASVVLAAYCGAVALVQAVAMIRSLLKGRFGLDLLALAGIASTLAVAEFWASLVVVLMLATGQALEDAAGRRATRELRALLDRQPQRAHRLDAAGGVEDVALAAVGLGDRLLVRPGEMVPVDLRLDDAGSSLDESQLTGESLPVEAVQGDVVPSGSVVLGRAMRGTTVATAAESQYQRIVRLVQEASDSRAPFVRLADRYALPFTGVSFAIAAVAWLISGDPVRFAEVLVVATPCPLLLAAPIAFVAGISRAAARGVIVRNGGALELLSRVRTVAFDKTGTITVGRPGVRAVRPAPGWAEAELLRLAAGVERYSAHPLAAAVVAEAERRGIGVPVAEDVLETPSAGVAASVDGHRVTVGKRAFVAPAHPGEEEPPGMAAFVGVDGRYAGAVLLGDPPREEAAAVLAALRRLGVARVLLLTGDREHAAREVGSAVGVDDLQHSCLPEDKVRAVRGAPLRPVAMVGDGVNDAPVLAAADVGIAMGARGSGAATESADVVVLVEDLGRVVTSIEIGRRTTTVARRAVLLGIGLSVVLMLIATTGVLPAIAGAALQELVDLATILYALRARVAGRAERGGPPDRGERVAQEVPAPAVAAGGR